MKTTIPFRLTVAALALMFLQAPAWSQTNKTVADFNLADVDGVEASLHTELETGRFVLLDFFSPYCHICKEKTGKVNQLQEDYAGRLTIWKLSVEPLNRAKPKDVEDFNRWYDSKIRSFPTAIDQRNYFMSEFGLGFGTPSFILVAPDRTVEFVYAGFNDNDMRARLNAAGLSPTSVTDRPDVSADIALSPQPARELLSVELPQGKQVAQLTLADMRGNVVLQLSGAALQENTGALRLNLAALEAASGVHMLRLEFSDETIAQKSVVLVR